jgi:hypothetical protein
VHAETLSTATLDVLHHTEITSHIEPTVAAQPRPENVKVEAEQVAVTEPTATPVIPRQGDLLAHSDVSAVQPAHAPANAEGTDEADAEQSKKDASHG